MSLNPNRIFPGNVRVPAGIFAEFNFRQSTFGVSGYGQATLKILDRFRVTGGARFSNDDKNGSNSNSDSPGAPPQFTASFPIYSVQTLRYNESKLTWLASSHFDVTPTVMLYGTVSTGFKSGGFNGRLAPIGAPLTFVAENATNYEAGVKSTFFDRWRLADVSIYKLNISGFQDSILNPLTGSGFIVGNAGDINAKGVELDLQARPIPQLSPTASGAYLHSRFSNYSAGQCYAGQAPNGSSTGTCNYNGRTPTTSPRFRGSIGAEFTQPIGGGLQAFARGDASYTSRQLLFATLDPRSQQSSYTVVNARLGLEGPDARWRVSLWAKNLADTVYYTSVAPVANGAFLSAGGTASVTPLIGWTGTPRTFGAEASLRFR